jgi:ubiquinone/menaquinone biosynthesis C-methylase UbiE
MSTDYVLGNSDAEIQRLDGQAAVLDRATRVLLRAAGIGSGMRVLDLGTGLGHVAASAAELVGSAGKVVGLDATAPLLAIARQRASAPQLTFAEGDVRTYRHEEPFDAVIGRLILCHVADPVAVVRHHAGALRSGGLMVALDFDAGSARAEPHVPVVFEALEWVSAALRSAGANPMIGTRLALHLAEAGLEDVQSFGVQGYFAPTDPRGVAMLSGVVRSLVPQMLKAGIATPEQLGLDTFDERVARAVAAAGAVLLPPTLTGAWGRRA